MTAIVKDVKKALAEQIGNLVAEVTLSTELFDDLGLSDLQVAGLVTELQAHYPGSEPCPGQTFRTVGDIVDCLKAGGRH
jgi:acyl carrier protein